MFLNYQSSYLQIIMLILQHFMKLIVGVLSVLITDRQLADSIKSVSIKLQLEVNHQNIVGMQYNLNQPEVCVWQSSRKDHLLPLILTGPSHHSFPLLLPSTFKEDYLRADNDKTHLGGMVTHHHITLE